MRTQSIFNFPFSLLGTLCVIFCSLFILSCSSPVENETGNLKGNITLMNDTGNSDNDPEDFGGITIDLFSLADIDTTIVRLNQQFPGIGVIIKQEWLFDHKSQIPVKSVFSSIDGSFKMQKIPTGTYNLLLSKPGWSTVYYYNVVITTGDNSINRMMQNSFQTDTDKDDSLILYPERLLSGSINSAYQFLRNHNYRVNDDMTIAGNVTLQNGACVIIQTHKNLLIAGNLTSENNNSSLYARITSDTLFSTDEGMFNGLQVIGNVTLDRCIFENSENGLRVTDGVSNVSNCIVRNGKAGITFLQNSNVSVDQSIAYNIKENLTSLSTSYAGFYTIGCQSVNMQNLILKNCSSGVKIKDFSIGQVHNCYFSGNSYGTESYSSDLRIHHNIFEKSNRNDIRVCGDQLMPIIDYNYITSPSGIIIGFDGGLTYVNCSPLINNNNISSSEIALHLVFQNTIDPDATNNYYYTTDLATINQLIVDRNDYDPNTSNQNWVGESTGYIIFQPYRNAKVAHAGIESK